MNSLPFNNLDEHLARFAASKKNLTSNQNVVNTKQFTFKKSLSLGKQSSSINAAKQSTLQSIENKKVSSNFNQISKNNQHFSSGKPSSVKQGTITNFFSQSNNAPIKAPHILKKDNLQTSFLNDDIFIDDDDDFIIPCSRAGTDKKSNSVSPENKNIEASFIKSNEISKIDTERTNKYTISHNIACTLTKKESAFEGNDIVISKPKPSGHVESSATASDERPAVSDFISSEELIDLEACTLLSFSDDEEEILSVSTKRKSIRKILSDDEDDVIDDNIKVKTEFIKSEKEDVRQEEHYSPVSTTSSLKIENFEQNCYLQNIDSANKPVVLNSLEENNVEIMTQICDLIEKEEKFLSQNRHLSYLVGERKKILKKFADTKKLLTHSPKPCGNILNESSHSKFQKLKPGMLFQPKTFDNGNTVNSVEKVQESPTTFSNKSNRVSNEKFLDYHSRNSSSPESLSLISSKIGSSFSALGNDFSTPFVSAKNYANISSFKEMNAPQNKFRNKDFFDSHSIDPGNTTSIKIEDIETQNLFEQSIYEINDDDPSPVSKSDRSEDDKEKIIAGKFYGNQRDDGASVEFKGFNFVFSQDLVDNFHNVFGLKMFRHNQLETINAALSKEDCFVLMPTGGGKSLCYQLPALVNSGVTIVVSPLRSLIMDQVQKLNSLDIPAYSLTGDTDTSTINYVYLQLSLREPGIKLLYVTPEKISASAKLISCLVNLYSRNMIQRFVIDEAHCVSQWGHDFRPDYKKLSVLREKFPKVSVMALTATATERVRMDILHQLGMKSPKWFLQSFNRPNLKYEVRPKTKSVVSDIINLIFSKFKNMCGIVYCLSRNDCDSVALELTKSGISASAYHAGMNNREEVQEAWINDKFKVICATIAFGMGIDKPDVRFVIHHAIPKSIEGYYQESGRAGRDGERSWCILYYCYKDMHRIKRMLMKDETNKHSWSTHFDNLFRMVHYCENKTDCRRVWMLGYFSEIFDKKLCLNDPTTACDNCFSKEVFEMCEVTEDAKAIIQCVAKVVDRTRGKKFTLPHFVDIYKGAKTQKILALEHDKLELHGKGHSLRRTDAERLLRKLVLDQFLHEDLFINQMDLPISYLYLGKRAKELMTGKIKVVMPFQKGTKNKHPVSVVTPTEDKEIQQLIEKCYNELIEISKTIAAERKLHYTNVVNVEALRQMSREMPMTEEDMLSIPHITRAVYEKYGKRFLDVTERYAAERCVMDAEKADNEMLSAFVDDTDNWSDAEPPSAKTNSRKGQKRKKYTQGGQAKKQKNNWKKRWPKAKAKGASSATQSSNKNRWSKAKKAPNLKNAPTTLKTPGFLPMPKSVGKPVSRSFLQAPKMTFM